MPPDAPHTLPTTRRAFLQGAAAFAALCVLPSCRRDATGQPAAAATDLFGVPNTPRTPRFIAHRGAHSLAPENSLPAFEEAAKRRLWAVETDIRRARDGSLVCCHNATLKHMFGVNARIADLSFDEIKKHTFTRGNGLDAFPAERLRMPLFSEYLDICERHACVPFIEIKDDVTGEVVRLLRDRKLERRAVISSVNFAHIEAARAASKNIFVHHIFSTEEHLPRLARLGHAGLSWKRKELDETAAALVEKTHKAGLRVCLRAADTRETALRMLELGLDYLPTNALLTL
ncbi:MAG: hypothetical protein LBR12_05460 [Opitutaceae bacterium]|jgi:glycerophosphoryl diester phosphodiesterase|nr:hypothetical protein [Opitutaceae bacterium]